MFELKTNLDEAVAALLAEADTIPNATKASLSVAIEQLWIAAKRLLTQLIYNREIPKWKNGRPKWKRKMRRGGILGSETYSVASDGRSASVHSEPSSKPAKEIKNWPGGYAQLQHDRAKREGSTAKPANWREQASEQGLSPALKSFRSELEKRLTKWRS